MLDKHSLQKDFEALGIEKGDTVFLRGNIAKIGRLKPSSLFLEVLLEVIGEEGTLVTLGFSKTFPFYRVKKSYIFDKNTPSSTGALAKIFMQHPLCQRSTHPSNSFLAIGKEAQSILKNHDENALSYTPMKALIHLNAKMIIFGIIEQSSGFTTAHYAQEVLGLTQKSWLNSLLRVYYRDSATQEIKLFISRDRGGCSVGFDKYYQHYLAQGILHLGQIGKSQAMQVSAPKAYEIEHSLLSQNPSFHFCDNPLCFSCRVSWKYDLKYVVNYMILKLIVRIKGLFR